MLLTKNDDVYYLISNELHKRSFMQRMSIHDEYAH